MRKSLKVAAALSFLLAPAPAFAWSGHASLILPTTAQIPGPSNLLHALPYYQCQVNYYVAANGNDSTGNGTSGSPWLTLAKAGASRIAGDCINVGPGTYSGVSVPAGGNLASATGYVAYRCTTMGSCIINANAGSPNFTSGFFIQNGVNYVQIDGFKISGSQTAFGQGVQVFGGNDHYSSHHIWVINDTIYNNGQSGLQMNDGEFFYAIHNEIYNNANQGCGAQGSGISFTTMKDTVGYTPTADDAHNPNSIIGAATFNDSGVLFRNVIKWNHVHNNAITNVACGTAASPSNTDGNNVILDSNTGNGNTLSGVAYVYPNHTLFAFNVLYNAGGSGFHGFYSGNFVAANNTCWNNYLDPFNQASGRGCMYVQNGSGSKFENNIAVGIPAAHSSCGYGYPNTPYAQHNSAIYLSYSTPGVTQNLGLHNVTFIDTRFASSSCGGETNVYNGDTYASGSNKQATNPLFVSVGATSMGDENTQPSAINFALQGSSQAIGYGLGETYLEGTSTDVGACASSLASCP